MTIGVLLCDDQPIVTDGIQAILETDVMLKVVGVARDGVEAVEMVPVVKPDIVLMDLKMPGMNGVHATYLIRRDYPAVPVLVLTTFDDDQWVMDAVRSGAAGYLLKDTTREHLIAAVKDTVAGKSHIDPGVAGKLLNRLAGTVRNHASSIFAKMGVTDRTQAVVLALRFGLVR